jgi:hypothetical protein
MSKIYEQIPKIMAEIGAIAKDRKNTQQNFQFRGIDDLLNRLYPILTKHKCFFAPEVMSFEQQDRPTKSGGTQTFSKVKMRYHLYAEDGSHVAVDSIGEAQDTADKSAAKSQSIAYKMAMITVFCIPVEGEMPDPDEDQCSTDPGDESLMRTIREAVNGAKSLEALNALSQRYEARKEKLNEAQIELLDQCFTDRIKSLSGK